MTTTFKTALAAVCLAALPSLAIAEGCGWRHIDETASQCPDGHAYDAQSGSCVKLTTS
ncbi:hypothetical protein CLV78_101840 [Aliiruegeria haliotis]|uniref:Chitin binding peritrophin-A-like protein n=1 Tax=Aliiruegeria haliotis TaxID=1280846 RepID=A0A2T0RZY6_9RHOB|nr:hypothetical protein [Aliiruegeria haliotis]PRY26739.1 hypothetical protein CLV78_101840 [Aliiruegeria haliotis]